MLDFVARQKAQSHTSQSGSSSSSSLLSRPTAYDAIPASGAKTAGEIVREAVLELTYTAHDMAPFARDMGYIDTEGAVLPPYIWDTDRRLRLRAKLDAIYFHLYGVTDRDDVRYIYSTFPIVEREELAKYGAYRSRDLCLSWMNALAAGQPGVVTLTG